MRISEMKQLDHPLCPEQTEDSIETKRRGRPTRLVAARWFAFVLLGVAMVVPGVGHAAPPLERSLSLELETGLRFDDNAFVDRRGQFGATAIPHIVGLLSSRTSFDYELLRWLDFSVEGEISLDELRFDLQAKKRTNDLRKTSARLDPRLEFRPLETLKIGVTPGIQVSREADPVWSYLQLAPSIDFSYDGPLGLVLEGSYNFTGKFYDSKAPSETYANIDMKSHRVELTAKVWHTKYLRSRVTSSFEYQSYAHNVGDLLGRILFLPIGQYEDPDATYVAKDRHDKVFKADAELLGVPFTWGAAAVGYQYEEDWGDLDTFTYRGHGPRLAIAFKYKGHELFGQAKVTFKNFYKFRFDTRYTDTRKDYKIDIYAKYGYVIKDWVRIDLLYSFFRNDSNDAAHFAFGHSRSYSLYQRSKVELTATFTFDFHKSAEQAPEVPGEEMAALVGRPRR